ncbi:NADH dehydrogenase subunit L [Austwickia chelonae]|uniref:NADH-quinone oxidoreductase subunit L n=1 Tax=Austwickia chelonae NBRC 105200 TaxID=1184607 RepID=K6V777_9MICO|nr:NADH-quinone oxidoreductase subunit L [Austwickia chelonae NBRC 105200]SEV95370.1 NADH dehydrogenase subunit L [Austwickia chelonae]
MQFFPSAVDAIAASSPSTGAAAATGTAEFGWLLVALPLLGAALLLVGGRATDKFGPLLATVLSWSSFGVGAAILMQMLGQTPGERAQHLNLFTWIRTSSLDLSAGMLIDQLSISFVLLVTFVGSLIHVYSLGYMEHDPDRRRFFAYLNLFVAAMLTLVLADSYLMLYVGWEGVGLASYLLIGFWNWNPPYASAANKAFIANRVGDFGLGLAIMLMFFTFGRVDFAGVHGAAAQADEKTLTAIGLFLLLAACGKSAQFPLQSWLGDAMAGPTPVSALIHAATMVTAGVYLVVRSHSIYNLAPQAQLAVTVVGAITLTMGAIIGCAKDDIKKALAASTMSQIGYMMLAAGLGPVGYAFAIFHLITHGFFKAGMFLGAGSVMHGMNNRVDMRTFGGLRTVMKVTWGTFMLGWLAILGVPPFAGFWSKDKIIEAAFVGEGWRPWVFGGLTMLVAGLTAFYMSRLFFMTFHGERRWTKDDHPHESPATMTVPMVVLAFGSAFLGLALSLLGFVDWLSPALGLAGHHEHPHPVIPEVAIQVGTLAVVLAGAAVAWMQYAKKRVGAPAEHLAAKIARNDFFQDDVNDVALVQPGNLLVRATVLTDTGGVDRSMTGLGAAVLAASSGLRKLQNGFVRSYALTMLVGIVVLLGAVWVVQ